MTCPYLGTEKGLVLTCRKEKHHVLFLTQENSEKLSLRQMNFHHINCTIYRVINVNLLHNGVGVAVIIIIIVTIITLRTFSP